MSADGLGPFENDGALDLCDELQGVGPSDAARMLETAWSNVTDVRVGDYLEKPAAEAAVAAAALALARISYDLDVLGEVGLAGIIPEIDLQMRSKAVLALARVLESDSELYRLWADVGAGEAWRSQIEEMKVSLAQG
jgi:hypothetical protein